MNGITRYALLLFFLLPALFSERGSAQYTYVQLRTFNYEGAPFNIMDPMARIADGSDLRLYLDMENRSDAAITGLAAWFVLYFEGRSEPVLFEYSDATRLEPGEIRNYFWDELSDPALGNPIAGVFAPLMVELSDGTYWSLRDYYAIGSSGTGGSVDAPVYPEVGAVTFAADSIGIINGGSIHGLGIGQRVGIIRKSGGVTEKVAQVKLLKTYANRSGFAVLYLYPGKKIEHGDRVQILLPGMSRLHATTKSMLLFSAVTGAAGGYYHSLAEDARDMVEKAKDEEGILYYSEKITTNEYRRDAAFLSSGLLFGGALLSEVLWGRDGRHLYPPESGSMQLRNWNTTTRSLMTTGALSIGSALYFRHRRNYAEERMPQVGDLGKYYFYYNQREEAKRRRDFSFILAGSSISAGLMHQFLRGNEWTFTENGGSRLSLDNWNPVSRGFLLMGGNSIGAALVLQYMRDRAKDSASNAALVSEQLENERNAERYRQWRDASYIIGGSALLSAVLHEFLLSPGPEDIFKTTCYLSFPDMSAPTLTMSGLTAAAGIGALYYHGRLADAESKIKDALDFSDPAGVAYYEDKSDDYKKYRTALAAAAGVSLGATVITHFLTRDTNSRRFRPVRNRSALPVTVSPEFDPLRNTIGLTVRF